MKYTLSKMSICGIIIALTGLFLTIQGTVIRYNLAHIKELNHASDIKNGRYIEYDVSREQLMGKYYTEKNGTIKYGPYCVTNAYTSTSTYLVAINREANYYIPLVIALDYQKDFDKMVNGETHTYHIFGKLGKFGNVLYYDTITECTGIESKSLINQMIDANHQIKTVALEDEREILYKGLSLLTFGLFIFFVTVERKKK